LGVNLCIRGKWEIVRIDGKVPMWRRKLQEDWVYKNPNAPPKQGGCCSSKKKPENFQ
jgi:hypothetical protein